MLKHFTPDRVVQNDSAGTEKNPCLTKDEIVQYLFHEVTEQERIRFESHLTICALCNDAVEGAQKFGSPVELRTQVALLQKGIRKKYLRSNERIRMPNLVYYSAAALALIALSGLSYWMMRDPNLLLADEFIRPYSNTIPLSRSQTHLTDLEEAMMDYESENYAEAMDKLEEFLTAQPDHGNAHLYCGVSGLLSGKPEKAIIHLEKASVSNDKRVAKAAAWYGALAYLRLGKTDSAAVILKEIVLQGGYFSESAQSILGRMKIK